MPATGASTVLHPHASATVHRNSPHEGTASNAETLFPYQSRTHTYTLTLHNLRFHRRCKNVETALCLPVTFKSPLWRCTIAFREYKYNKSTKPLRVLRRCAKSLVTVLSRGHESPPIELRSCSTSSLILSPSQDGIDHCSYSCHNTSLPHPSCCAAADAAPPWLLLFVGFCVCQNRHCATLPVADAAAGAVP